MFVVDCTDKERLSIVQEILENMASHPNLEKRKIPFLILANKQDDDSAINEMDLRKYI
jgi:signal recognition particle receptor subunit beta